MEEKNKNVELNEKELDDEKLQEVSGGGNVDAMALRKLGDGRPDGYNYENTPELPHTREFDGPQATSNDSVWI